MRKLKRFLRRLIAEWKNRKRREEVLRKISKHLGEQVTLRQSGSRGADSIFEIVSQSGKQIAVLRLLNPYRKKKTAPDFMPYCILSGETRIAREKEAYLLGAGLSLTPKVLWDASDALVCEYFSGEPILEHYLKGRVSATGMIEIGWNALSKLHDLGISHMDASVQNVLLSDSGSNAVLVDFEFGSALDLSFEDQCLYDYFRYLESSLKFISLEEEKVLTKELEELNVIPVLVLEKANIKKIIPALERLSLTNELWATLQKKCGKS